MKRVLAIALYALVFLLSAAGIAPVAECVIAVRQGPVGISPSTLLIPLAEGWACLNRNRPEHIEQDLHRAGINRMSAFNLCRSEATAMQRVTALLVYGLPLAPQAVVSFEDTPDTLPVIEHLAPRRLMVGTKPSAESNLTSHLNATKPTRGRTKSEDGSFLVPSPFPKGGVYGFVTQAMTEALVECSAGLGAPVLEDRARLFEAVAQHYRDSEQRSISDTVKGSL